MQHGKQKKRSERDAVILLAGGYDEGFVSRCVSDLRDEGIRTHLIGTKSQFITGQHGVEIKADDVLRRWSKSSKTGLVVLPGRRECVKALAVEPEVPKLIRQVLKQDGCVAVAHSAESFLEQQKTEAPPDMRILPENIPNGRYLAQGADSDRDFIRSLIDHIR